MDGDAGVAVMHTQLPWKIASEDDFVTVIHGPQGQHIAEVEIEFSNEFDPHGLYRFEAEEGRANAALIVTAVNGRVKLIEALKQAIHLLNIYANRPMWGTDGDEDVKLTQDTINAALKGAGEP